MHSQPPMKTIDEVMRCYGGGGSAAAQQIDSAPIPTPAPPVTPNNQSVLMAEHDMAAQNLLKKSVAKTIFAGDTGGYNPAKPVQSKQTTGYKV